MTIWGDIIASDLTSSKVTNTVMSAAAHINKKMTHTRPQPQALVSHSPSPNSSYLCQVCRMQLSKMAESPAEFPSLVEKLSGEKKWMVSNEVKRFSPESYSRRCLRECDTQGQTTGEPFPTDPVKA